MGEEVKLLSVADAAKKLGVTRARVNQLISGLRLPATRIGRSYVIREPDLKLVEKRKAGRPPKEAFTPSRKQGRVNKPQYS